jgi:hypothetical protein
MPQTPKAFLTMLDMVTAPTMQLALPQTLGATERVHVARVRSVFDDPNIIGAGVAEKITDKGPTGTLALCFYVRKKLPKERVKAANMLPPVMATPDGKAVFTDVIEIGKVVPQLTTPLVRRKPIQSGYSVGHFNITAGTLGAIVTRNKKKYLLSNSHVLADSGQGKRGDAIYYPGPADNGKPADTVAKLAFFRKFVVDNQFSNEIDAALAQVLADDLTLVNYKIHGAKTPIKTADPQRDMKIVVMGRTSGVKKSVVRDVDFRIQADYPLGTVGFTGQVRCDTYSAGGDSGSIIVDAGSGAIVGLHFAGSPQGSIFTPIRKVMAALKFRF